MRTGLWILCGFAAAWGIVALNGLHAPLFTWIAPVLISLVLAIAVGRKVAAIAAGAPPQDGRHVGRVVGLWSAIEAVAIIAAVNIVPALGYPRLVGPAVGVVVGLHFLPLARGIPSKPYYVTGLAMVATSLAACALPGSWPQIAAGAAAALNLWLTALALPMTRRQPAAS
jgi:hypothetical protein